MSRIGKLPVAIPSGVSIDIKQDVVSVKGPKGLLTQPLVDLVSVKVEGENVLVERANDSRPARAYHGLMRSLLNNMVTGVSAGFEKKLQVEGTGFRAEVKGKDLVLTLGYSHLINFPIPSGIDIAVDKLTNISIKGIDKQQVGQVAAKIRAFRKPDSYKGKGIRYVGEHLRLKEGKSA